jgi:hypothetical protein
MRTLQRKVEKVQLQMSMRVDSRNSGGISMALSGGSVGDLDQIEGRGAPIGKDHGLHLGKLVSQTSFSVPPPPDKLARRNGSRTSPFRTRLLRKMRSRGDCGGGHDRVAEKCVRPMDVEDLREAAACISRGMPPVNTSSAHERVSQFVGPINQRAPRSGGGVAALFTVVVQLLGPS